jgi:hypothetical protein
MAVNPTYPGVYIQELPSAVHPITGVATSIGAFVGYTARGIDQRAEQIFSFSDYERLFGGLASNSELSYAVQQFFNNGGTQAYVVRVPCIGASGATVAFGQMTFTALSSGCWANGELLIDVDYNGLYQALPGNVGVDTGSPTVTGAGFLTNVAVNDYLVFASDTSQTPYQVIKINSNTTLTLGANYVPAGGATTTTAVVIADPLAFNLTINDLVDRTPPESFPNVTLNSTLNNYVMNVVNDVDNGSQLVKVVVGSPTPALPPAMSGVVGTPPAMTSVDVLLGGAAVAGTVTLSAGSQAVTRAGYPSTPDLSAGQWLVFASDPTLTPYQIESVGVGALTLAVAYAKASATTTAVMANIISSPFELTGTVDLTASATVTGVGTTFTTQVTAGQWLVFASDTTQTPYQISGPPAPAITNTSLTLTKPYAGPPVPSTTTASIVTSWSGTVAVTSGSTKVTGTGTAFTKALTVGQSLVFGADSTNTLYQISSIASDTSLTLTQNYAGTTNSSTTAKAVNTAAQGNYGVELNVISPATPPSPLPLAITVFANKAPLPQTVSGLASQLQKAINSALAVQMQGASVVCSVSGTGAGQAIRVNAMLPQFPDAVISITTPPATSGLLDASVALGLNIPSSLNVAHYALGTGNGSTNDVVLAGTVDVAAGSNAVTGTSTAFTTALAGQWLVFGSDLTQTPYQVSATPAPTATSLTLVENYAGTVALTNSTVTLLGWAGQATSSTPGSDGSGLPGTDQLIGDQGLSTGIYALQNVDQFNLLCIPDATRAYAGNPSVLDSSVDPNAIYSAAIALCVSKRAFLLLDCPPYVNTVPAAVDWKTSGLTVSNPNGAAFFPRLRLPDPLNKNNLRTFAPCGVVAGLYAQTDASRGVWKAPAGTAATLAGVQSLVYKMSDAENGVLNPLGLNCFRTFPVYGSVLWGARTLVGADVEASQWKYVPVRRVALFLESSLYQGTQWVVFEPNDEPLWSAIRLNVGSFMQGLFHRGYFQGSTPSQAYFVKCDSETTTQTDIDNGIVNIVVGFAPLEPAEFVIIQIQQMAGQTSS